MWLGFRYEEFRFRLERNAGVQGGVGEDKSFPLFAGVRYGLPFANISFVTGAELGGRLRIENNRGRKIASQSFDPAAFVGATAEVRF